jgi:hypothetical protein
MLITKFNKMLRNRIVWWIIGGIVIFTFVGWFSPRGGCEVTPKAGSAGTLNGEPVSDAELSQARFHTFLGLCLMTGRAIAITPELDKELREQAWKRVAALREARRLNITATPEEVLVLLQRDPQFQSNGGFDKQRYQGFCRNVLGSLGASMPQFERQLAETIILQKLQMATSAAAWITPMELARLAARYADSFTVATVTLPTNAVTERELSVSEAEIKSFFEANTNMFEVPAKVAVRYIEAPISNSLAKALVEAAAVEDYYNAHTDEFTVKGTNDTDSLIPFAEVANTISNRLRWEAATQLTRDSFIEMAVSLTPDREGNAPSFEALASRQQLTVKTTGLFDAYAEVKDVDAGPAFNQAAFRLRPSPDEYFSDAIVGAAHVYLLALSTNTDAYIPAFEAVHDEVKPHALGKARRDALARKADALHEAFRKGLAARQTFESLALQGALNVSTTVTFTVHTAPEALNTPDILEEITSRNSGDITDPIPTADGFLIAYIVERRAASPEEMATVQQQVAMSSIRRRARLLFGDWERSLVGGKRRQDLRPAATAEDGE